MQVVQLNLNHCREAQLLLDGSQFDVALLSEPYRIPTGDPKWASDEAGLAAIRVGGSYPIQELLDVSHKGFVVVKIGGVFVCSCYAPPRWSIMEYERMLDEMVEALERRRPLLIAGDFNAWSTSWGSRTTTPRGSRLQEALARLDVVLANRGNCSTFSKNGRESVIDVTFCSPELADGMHWRVSDEFTYSDHFAVRYSVGNSRSRHSAPAPTGVRWKTSAFSQEAFLEVLRREEGSCQTADDLVATMKRACDAAMPRRRNPPTSRRPAFWWTPDISASRKQCLQARRRMQRAKTPEERESRHEDLKAAKKTLQRLIASSKRSCFQELMREAESNPWGGAFRLAMKRLKSPNAPRETCPDRLKAIVAELFPAHDGFEWPSTPHGETGSDAIVAITQDELRAAAQRMSLNKAPGPDGIPNVAVRTALQHCPSIVLRVMQKCLDDGVFPDCYKRQMLRLLLKPGKDPGDPSSFRPICLLDILGKLLELVILNKLTILTEGARGLSDTQFSFRKRRSTTDPIRRVVAAAKDARQLGKNPNRLCAVVTIDVKNAFNIASWPGIARAL